MKEFRYFSWLLFASLLFANTAGASGAEIRVGQPFPNLFLPSMEDGGPVSIADFRGQKAILHIWASW
ncbi:MAG: hypothetical protein V3T61_12080 [Acidobacteriota bacterium]